MYTGIAHETDWFATFASLAGASLQKVRHLDGIDMWSALRTSNATFHRKEALISDKILRVGKWKLVVGGTSGRDPQNWWASNLKGCMLGTGGGWLVPNPNRTASCPGDIYTSSNCRDCLGCPDDERTINAVTDAVDLWLCSDPCTMESPCLWNLEADPLEEHEIAKANPSVVSEMVGRLRSIYEISFSNGTSSGDLIDNGEFCSVLNGTEVAGLGVFLAPWMPDAPL
eukprot:SAG31_NODE_1174_length_9538_cov_3.152453_15_plen_227_part_00